MMDPYMGAVDPQRLAGKAILVVDDELDFLHSLQTVLQDLVHGLNVTLENHPVRALKRAYQERFDVVVSDLRMPHMDGIELLDRIGQQRPGTGRVLLTAYPDVRIAQRAQERLGNVELLIKPFEVGHLVRKIVLQLAN